MKVFMMTDMEGVAGVVSFEPQAYPTGKYYEDARRLTTAEVNAAVEGLLHAGADDILVGDFHGPGAIVFEDLHSKARLMHGRPLAPRALREAVLGEYDVGVMIGQHAMAGGRSANLNHTQSSRTIDHIKLNGKPIGEIAQFALHMGGMDIPVILLTGDEAACEEAADVIPGVHTVAVKQGLGRNSAISLSAPEARQRIEEGAKQALLEHKKSPRAPVKWDGPYVLEKRFFHTDVADREASAADAERVDDQTVRFKSDDILSIIYR